MKELDVHILLELTDMLHQVSTYMQTFKSVRKWVIGDQVPPPYEMVIHANKSSISQHAGP